MAPLELLALFQERFNCRVESALPIKEHASSRRIYRLKAKDISVVGVVNRDLKENLAFINLAKFFASRGVRVPEILAVSHSQLSYLQSDLGDVTLLDKVLELQKSGSKDEIIELYRRALSDLARIQIEVGGVLDYSLCYPSQKYGEEGIRWDINYFKESFLSRVELDQDLSHLEEEFEKLISVLLEVGHTFFMYRDFQARNIMVHDNNLYYIDFDRGRRGALYYDLATLLYQGRVSFTVNDRLELESYYLKQVESRGVSIAAQFEDHYIYYVLLQLMHRLAAYGRLGIGLGMPYFLESIPFALSKAVESFITKNSTLCPALHERFPSLNQLFINLYNREQKKKLVKAKILEVKIKSFAFKNGIPDMRGGESNGGFVFDCRIIDNPGRDPNMALLTGRDIDIGDFLEGKSEYQSFKSHIISLVDAAVEKHLARGFVELVILFGCTGGRHRSVYTAETVARYLAFKYPLKVNLEHRELIDIF
jgi:aminoglycoside/choline kinase family phosphotransferase